jgi:predicted MFS family arabinose efflux permease
LGFTKARSAQAQRSIVAVFFLQAVIAATQIPRIPEIIKQIDVDFTTWGLITGFSGVGGLLGLMFTSKLIARYGTKTISIIGSIGGAAMLSCIGLIHNPVLYFVAAFLTAILYSTFNIALNSQTVALQKALNRVVIGKFHASWALGAAFAAAFSGFMATLLPLSIHLFATGLVTIGALIFFTRGMLTNKEDGHGHGKPATKAVSFFKSPAQVWILSAGLFSGVLGEVAMMDWSALLGKETLLLDAGRGAIPYTGFSIALILGRLLINPLSKRWHLSSISRVAAFISAAAIAGAVFIAPPLAASQPDFALVLTTAFFVIAGLGCAPVVPSFMSAAGHVPGLNTAQVLARMSLVNSVALMTIKIFMGHSAQEFGVQFAFLYGVAGMAIAGILAGLVAKRAVALESPENSYPATGTMQVVAED